MIRSGVFGWEDYFVPVVDAITVTDFYLLANDFMSYIETQACMGFRVLTQVHAGVECRGNGLGVRSG